jgi:hypothetical protein
MPRSGAGPHGYVHSTLYPVQNLDFRPGDKIGETITTFEREKKAMLARLQYGYDRYGEIGRLHKPHR